MDSFDDVFVWHFKHFAKSVLNLMHLIQVQDKDLQAAHPSQLIKLTLLTRVDLFSNNVLESQVH